MNFDNRSKVGEKEPGKDRVGETDVQGAISLQYQGAISLQYPLDRHSLIRYTISV